MTLHNVLVKFLERVSGAATEAAAEITALEPDQPPAPIDCQVSDWSDWGPWSAWDKQNDGLETRTRMRTRTIVQSPQHGGTACPVLDDYEREERLIFVDPPTPVPVDCSVSDWSEWGPWVTEGPLQRRSRTRTVLTPPAHGGVACGPLVEEETKPANSVGDSSPISRNEILRIWVTNDTLPALRARLGTGGGLHEEAKWWIGWLDPFVDAPGSVNQWFIYLGMGLAYLLTRDGGSVEGVTFNHTTEQYGAFAKKAAMDYVATGELGDEAGVQMAVLNWVWTLLSPEEKTAAAKWIKAHDKKGDSGSPWVVQHEHVRGMKVMGAIVLHGLGLDDDWATKTLAMYRPWFRDLTGVTRSESELGAGIDAGNGQGLSYAWGHTLRNTLMHEEAYRTAFNIPDAIHYGGPDANFFRLQPRHLAYRLIPAAGKWFVEKGHYNTAGGEILPTGFDVLTAAFEGIAGIYQHLDQDAASLASWALETHLGRLKMHPNNVTGRHFEFFRLIRGSEALPAPKSPVDLGLPLDVGGGDYGRVLWKTSWGQDDVQVDVSVNRWALNGTMPIAWPGSFQVFRKGPQVVNQWGWASGHSGIIGQPGNHLIFPDVNPVPPFGDYGGYRGSRNRSGADQFLVGSVFDERDALDVLHPSDVGYGYVFVDTTRGFANTRSGSVKPRVSSVTRQLVYLPPKNTGEPVILVILDKATRVSAEFEARWIAHTAGRPEIQSDGSVIATLTEHGFNGRVFITSLLTTTARVSEGSNTPYGRYDAAYPRAAFAASSAVWFPDYTVDLRRNSSGLTDEFVTVVEVGDSGATKTPTFYLGLHTIQVGTRVVTFGERTATVDGL